MIQGLSEINAVFVPTDGESQRSPTIGTYVEAVIQGFRDSGILEFRDCGIVEFKEIFSRAPYPVVKGVSGPDLGRSKQRLS